MTLAKATERTWWDVFRYPVLLGAATALGLGVALLGEHVAWRAITWVTVAAPVAVVARAVARGRRVRR